MKSLTHYNDYHTGKLLEATFEETPRFRQKLDRNSGVSVDIYNSPDQWQSPYVLGGILEWTLDISYRDSGIEVGSAYLKSLGLLLEVEDPQTGEIGDEFEIELGPDDISWENTSSTIGKPDWYLNAIEIDMQNSPDPQNWKYSLDIGN